MGTRRDYLKIAGASVVASSTILVESGAAAETARKALVPPVQSPELVSLYETYTAGPTSIGADLTRMTVKAGADDPLIVATGTDMAIFPGGGRPPAVQSFPSVDTRVQGTCGNLSFRAGACHYRQLTTELRRRQK
jgi:hypothetical protein